MANYQYKSFSNDNENPFGDPHQGNQPTINSSQEVNSDRVEISGLDDFNPFERRTVGVGAPAVLPTADVSGGYVGPGASPPYTPSAGIKVTTEELERRQRELEMRENDLRRREEEIRQRANASGNQPNNWPPLPSFLPFGPCFYQDIEVEIPLEYRRIVRLGYYLWICHCVIFLFNIIAAIAYMAGLGGTSEAASTFGLSIIFAVLFIPASFLCWFRPLYKAFRSDSSFYFFFFFLVFAAQIFVIFIQCLGINWFAGCGWINGISVIGSSGFAAAIMLICGSFFTIIGICDVLLLVRVHRIYRGTGASFEKAKLEFSQGVLSNANVRSAAMDVGSSAVLSGMNNNASVRY